MDAWLDPLFSPAGTFDLIRLGKDNDGGYLVDRRCVQGAGRLISFGLDDDWSFEAGFRRLNPVPVDIYDHTVSKEKFRRDAFGALSAPHRPGRIVDRFRTYRGYSRFMRGKVRHHRQAIGYDRPGASGLTSIIDALPAGSRTRLFVKVDIETWEYRILDQIVDNAARLEGLAIEFHDVDLHLKRITDFLRRLPLYLCHIHSNNFCRATPDGLPMALEVSFSRHQPLNDIRPEMPHPLDQPNNPATEEFRLRFRD